MKKLMLGMMLGCLFAGCTQPGPDASSKSKGAEGDQTNAMQRAATTENDTAAQKVETTEMSQDAENLLSETLAQANRENKRVMVHLGAPW